MSGHSGQQLLGFLSCLCMGRSCSSVGPKPWLWMVLDQKHQLVLHMVWLFLNGSINSRLMRYLLRADYIFLSCVAGSCLKVMALYLQG